MAVWIFRFKCLLSIAVLYVVQGWASDFLWPKDIGNAFSFFNNPACTCISNLTPRTFQGQLVSLPKVKLFVPPEGPDVRFLALANMEPVRAKYHVDMVLNFGFGDSGSPLLALTYKF